MQAYWWECEVCETKAEFTEITKDSSVVSFIRGKLVPSGWDQSLLQSKCTHCPSGTLRITYEFPRKNKEILRVVHMVGLEYGEYLPMMWETYQVSSREDLFDFKYIIGRNPFGLNKPAAVSRKDLHALFELYRTRTNTTGFP